MTKTPPEHPGVPSGGRRRPLAADRRRRRPEPGAGGVHERPGRPPPRPPAPRPPGRPCAESVTGAQSLVRSLESLGVEVMFGIPGGAILPAYDPIFDSKVRHILVRHEQGAGHAATGYAQATGKVGVCIATSGPGRDQPGHADRRRVHGLGGDGGDHRPGPARRDRLGRLPGGRHPRHHAADHQAQLPGAVGRGPAADPGRGVPPRRHRPPRPGAGRRAQGRAAGPDRVLLAAHDGTARLPADAAAARQADPRGGQAHRDGPPAGAVRRRRRAQGRRRRRR